MTNSTVLLFVLIVIVLGFLLIWWLIKTFAPMGKRENGIYAKAIRKPFECPYDLESCDYVDTSTNTIAIQCQDCKRYNNGIRPSMFDKRTNICPFDQNYCSILGKSMIKGYVTKVCQNCPRYKSIKEVIK